MEFRVLGPLEVVGESGPLQLGGPKQRAVLAHLILRSDRLVSAGTLIDELWGDEPPETARNTLQTYVYRLRKVIGDTRIEAGSGGYVLHAGPGEIDVARFEALVKEAEDALPADPAASLVALDQGLALWRGDALADLADEPSLRAEIARLEELRLAATDLRISTKLQRGLHSTVISELEALTSRHPLRERFWAQLMTALYRAGRQAEALDAYRRAREVLADELGADPSPELQHLHEQILRHEVKPSPASATLDVPATDAPNEPASQPVPARRASRGRRVAIGALAAVAVVALIAALLQTVGAGPARADFQPGIAIVDRLTGEPLASIPTSAIRQPAEVIYANEHFWVHNLDPDSFVEIDPKTGSVLTQIAAPFQDVGTFTVDGNTLWVTGQSVVVKIDIDLRREVDRFELPHPTHGVVVADGSLWVTMPGVDVTLRLDPATGNVEHRFADLPGSLALAYGDGSIWTSGWTSPFGGFTGGGGVNRIDPDTNSITKTALVLPVDCCPAAAGGGFGWTADPTKGVVYKVDPSGEIVATSDSGPGATIGSYSDGVVWAANSDVGTVTGIDALTGAEQTFRFQHPVQGVAAGSGVLIATLGPGRTYEDVIDGLGGTVARLFAPPGQLATPDPASMFGGYPAWVEQATCATLLSYQEGPEADGWSLQPEIAASMPNVSADGRTYTFTVRPGYRFSPPSDEIVTAETFRYSIERALSPDVGGIARYFVSDIVGQRAFRHGESDHISGLRADGATLTIELTAPSQDFLERVSVPFLCPVPIGTPWVPGGAGAYAGYPHSAAMAVPSTGPYYLADHLDGEYSILKPNPNYAGPRPRAFDAIALREGVDPGIAVGLVESGAWDGIVHVFDPILIPTGPVAEKYGGEEVSDEDLRYYPAPTLLTGFFAFNASRSAFSDPDVRRAAALVIDREKLAAIWGNVPTDQYLPPVLPGAVDLDLYPLDGSGLDEARSLMRGREVTAVFGVVAGNERARLEAQVVQSSLAQIGITIEIREFPDLFSLSREPNAEIDMMGAGDQLPYADTASFLTDLMLFGVPRSWLPRGVAEEVVRLGGLTDAERQSAAVALADRLAIHEVPIAVDLYGAEPFLLSSSLGCRTFPPAGYGVDLAGLCPSQT